MSIILYLLTFIGGALCDHYFEAKFRAWAAAKEAQVKAAL